MRVYIALLCGLALATSAALAQAPDAAGVPPLAAGEIAPADLPNYFDARELGAATLAARLACQQGVASTVPDADADAAIRSAYCDCFADAARWNVRQRVRWTPTDAETTQCLDAIRIQALSPFADRFSIAIDDDAGIHQACLQDLGTETTPGRAVACSCATDAWLAHGQDERRFATDVARCAAAGRYRDAAGRNPTMRQFWATRVPPATANPRSSAPTPGMFIPYEGNGLGPTLCADGMYSHSSGRGTCSHHGGIAGGHRRHR